MRRISIATPKLDFVSCHVLYDGPENDKHRREFNSLNTHLDSIPKGLEKYNVKKPIEVYFRGYTPEQERAIKLILKDKLPKARYSESH